MSVTLPCGCSPTSGARCPVGAQRQREHERATAALLATMRERENVAAWDAAYRYSKHMGGREWED